MTVQQLERELADAEREYERVAAIHERTSEVRWQVVKWRDDIRYALHDAKMAEKEGQGENN